MATLVHQVSCLGGSGFQAVWPELLGWFRLCGRGLVSCLDGSGCGQGSSQLLGWFRLSGCVARV